MGVSIYVIVGAAAVGRPDKAIMAALHRLAVLTTVSTVRLALKAFSDLLAAAVFPPVEGLVAFLPVCPASWVVQRSQDLMLAAIASVEMP
jgi:hypothetical protein